MTVTLSTTAFSDYATCPKKYWYRHVEKLVPQPRRVRRAMRLGIWIHACLEAYHRGEQWPLVLGRMEAWAKEHGVPEQIAAEMHADADRIVTGYIDHWKRHGEPWKTIFTEKEMVWTTPSGKKIKATLDMGIENRTGLWIVESKSTSEIPSAAWRAIDPQTALQWFVARQNGFEALGIIFNYLLTAKPTTPRVRNDGFFYEQDLKTTTTSDAFDQAREKLVEKWKGTSDELSDYWLQCRNRAVNDGAFYQRYVVIRPTQNVKETLKDVGSVLKGIEEGRFHRAFHVINCTKFCSYSELCAAEYTLGGVAQGLRDADFAIETPELRNEGR